MQLKININLEYFKTRVRIVKNCQSKIIVHGKIISIQWEICVNRIKLFGMYSFHPINRL